MYISEEKFNDLLEVVSVMKARLELYEKYEHAREKEFRELERDVFRLKNERKNQQIHAQPMSEHSAGVAWLR